jgi:hypothetical protein
MKAYRGFDLWLHAFLISALDGSEWSDSHPSQFILGKSPRYPLIGALVGSRAGLHAVKNGKISCPY